MKSLCGCWLRDSFAQKIGFLCKEKWISLSRLWISSGDTAGNPANCFQIRSEMGLLLQRRHFAFLSHIECIDLKLWLTWLQIDINYQSLTSRWDVVATPAASSQLANHRMVLVCNLFWPQFWIVEMKKCWAFQRHKMFIPTIQRPKCPFHLIWIPSMTRT